MCDRDVIAAQKKVVHMGVMLPRYYTSCRGCATLYTGKHSVIAIVNTVLHCVWVDTRACPRHKLLIPLTASTISMSNVYIAYTASLHVIEGRSSTECLRLKTMESGVYGGLSYVSIIFPRLYVPNHQ